MKTQNRFTKSLMLVAVAVSLASGLTHAQHRGRPQTLQVPSDQFPTIQSAINAAANGDKVLVGPGVYEEILTIAKRISITGSGALGERRTQIVGPRPTEVVTLDRAIGVVNYRPDGGGKIENLLIRGRDAGILGVPVGDRSPAALEVKEVIIHQGGRGIAGSFSDLTVEQTKVADMLWHGVVLVRPKGKILFSDSVVDLSLGIGFYSLNSEGGISLLNSTFGVNSKGGVVIVGSPVSVTKCYFYANNYAGIRLKNVQSAQICHNLIKLTLPKQDDGRFGDGLVAECSQDVFVCQDGTNYALDWLPPAIADNARVGISSFLSHITLSGVTFDCNLFHVAGEDGSIDGGVCSSVNEFSYDDLGGNQCGCDLQPVACQVVSPGLAPPEPIPPT